MAELDTQSKSQYEKPFKKYKTNQLPAPASHTWKRSKLSKQSRTKPPIKHGANRQAKPPKPHPVNEPTTNKAARSTKMTSSQECQATGHVSNQKQMPQGKQARKKRRMRDIGVKPNQLKKKSQTSKELRTPSNQEPKRINGVVD